MEIQAVFFDFDGVIIDSEKIYFIYWKKAFETLGYKIKDEQVLNLRSADKHFVVKYLQENLDSKIDLNEYNKIRNLRIEFMNEYLKNHKFELKNGVYEILEYLYTKKAPCYIVSASYKQDIQKYLQEFNLSKYFKEIISTKSLELGKPFPYVYNYASSLVNIDKKYILAIEDLPNGIISAKQANLNTCMIPDLSNPDKDLLSKIDILQSNLIDLKEYLEINNII